MTKKQTLDPNSIDIEKLSLEGLYTLCEAFPKEEEGILKLISLLQKDGLVLFQKQYHTPLPLLCAITHHIKHQDEVVSAIKYHLKSLKVIFNYLETHNDSLHLLLHDDRHMYSAKDNFHFLACADVLSDILNEHGYVEEADQLFMLKGKIELGVKRYLHNTPSNTLIAAFSKEYTRIASFEETLILTHIYTYDYGYKKNFAQFTSKHLDRIQSLRGLVYAYLLLKEYKLDTKNLKKQITNAKHTLTKFNSKEQEKFITSIYKHVDEDTTLVSLLKEIIKH